MSTALLTAACVISSYQMESSKVVTKLWGEIRRDIRIGDDIDLITAIMTTGRIMDLQAEKITTEDIKGMMSGFKDKIMESGLGEDLIKDMACAFVTSSIISHSEEVETITSIMKIWNELRENLHLGDAMDLASAILATGHIMDLRVDVKSPEVVKEILTCLKKEMEKEALEKIGGKEIAILLLAAAFVELTPKVEKYRDIVRVWSDMRKSFELKDEIDMVAVILLSGKVRDFDMTTLLHSSSIPEQVSFMRSALERL